MNNLVNEKSDLLTQIDNLTEELAQSKQKLLSENTEQNVTPSLVVDESQTTSSIPDSKSNDSGVGLSESLQNGPRLSNVEGNSTEDEKSEPVVAQVSLTRAL